MNGRQLIALHVLSIEAVPAAALLHMNDFGRTTPIAGYAWLYRADSNSSWSLIDTGTENVEPLNAGRPPGRHWQPHSLLAALAQHGVAPEDVKDVILTHLHADHCGSVELFPHAQWHVPAVEWEFVCNPDNADLVPEPLFPQFAIGQMKEHGVQRMNDGDQPVQGLRVKHLGGHSIGLMAIEICDDADKTLVVLGGDVMPLYENLERQIPPGTLWHWGECVRALKYLSTLQVPVLPGHDTKLLEKYPKGVILDG